MGIAALLQRLQFVEIRRLLVILGMVILVVSLFQCFALTSRKSWSPYIVREGTVVMFISNATITNNSKLSKLPVFERLANDAYSFKFEEEGMNTDHNLASEKNEYNEFTMEMGASLGKSLIMGHASRTDNSSTQAQAIEIVNSYLKQVEKVKNKEVIGGVQNKGHIMPVVLPGISTKNGDNMDTYSRAFFPANVPSADNVTQTVGTQPKNATRASIFMLKRWETQPISISQMNSLLLQSLVSSHSMRPRRSSACDRDLLSAKSGIENAPIARNTTRLDASVFRNVSTFKRSYELMECILKVYIYKEGEKPIFHQSKMRGIYASEGWFMKLIEGNKKFLVRDPRKAHLFFLPVSSQMLRTALFAQNFQSQKELEEYVKNYVDLVAQKYSFWNRTGGADHFLVGCHDWAPRITRHHMRNCIRALCNANAAKGFKIGKDTTLPVTYVHSAETPLQDIGGNPSSKRSILAFFAGGIHGYLRPILLQCWENKEPDMKIFGPMPRDVEGKKMYREYMKSSKYCICARGYEVHTPRVVEAIFYECVPVIISDNYVPPFFEVLNWEAFAVFVQEKDIPNLRNILLSIPEEKYIAMQLRVKIVQQHFLWHKKPVKYDLFHMILHSVWYNRVFQMKSR